VRGINVVSGLMAAVVLAGTATLGRAAPTPREILGGELIVKDTLDRMEVPVGRIQNVHDDELARAFPNYLFYTVIYPRASAAGLPEPLKAVNLFAVAPDGRAKLVSGSREWAELFKAGFVPGRGVDRARLAARAVLLLVQAEYPEYRFTVSDDDIRVTRDPRGRERVVGKLVPRDGGGAIDVVLTLGPDADVGQVVLTERLRQADPAVVTVRAPEVAVAERVVRARLVEVKRTGEEVRYVEDAYLKRLYPGYRFFLVPPGDPDRRDAGAVETLGLMVVGPDGKAVDLFARGDFYRWLAAVLGPVTDDAHARSAMELVEHLLMLNHPKLEYGTPEEPRITIEEDGVRLITARVPYSRPNGNKAYLSIRLRFGKAGRLVAWSFFFGGVRDAK
jgi:hypothetical protein